MKKYKKIICMIAAVCLLGAAAFCGFRIYSHYAHESEQEEVFEKIAKVVEQAQTGESETVDVLLTEEETVLAEYGELYLQNTDMVGWLSIAGTNINYPVKSLFLSSISSPPCACKIVLYIFYRNEASYETV